MTASKTTRTLYVKCVDGERIIEGIPADAKVTFGKVQPGQNPGGFHNHDSYCLRIYTSRENQLAVFTGVISFRDSTLNVKKRVAKTETVSKRKETSDQVVSILDSQTDFSFVDEE